MFPPSTAGCAGSAARMAAASDAVVVLPFVPVTPTVGAGHSRRNRSGSETSAGALGSPAGSRVDEGPQRRPEAGLGRRVVRVDRRRRGHEVGRRPGRRRLDVRTQCEAHRAPLERRDRRSELARRSPVVDRDPGAGIGEEPRERDPAPGEPQHGHRTVAQDAGADALERERVGIDRAGSRHRRHHSSRLSDARKSVTPRSAARIPMIQNRTVIFSSSQPPNSK